MLHGVIQKEKEEASLIWLLYLTRLPLVLSSFRKKLAHRLHEPFNLLLPPLLPSFLPSFPEACQTRQSPVCSSSPSSAQTCPSVTSSVVPPLTPTSSSTGTSKKKQHPFAPSPSVSPEFSGRAEEEDAEAEADCSHPMSQSGESPEGPDDTCAESLPASCPSLSAAAPSSASCILLSESRLTPALSARSATLALRFSSRGTRFSSKEDRSFSLTARAASVAALKRCLSSCRS
mmetsp:Transcript_29865/g.58586  ORF Transcript_29865/g.58586 Transcript_29865/m.58586 type:complete len:232 (-) Transcript_29865:912-1607(-)